MKADEQAEVHALRKQVRELKGALADAHLDMKLEAAYLKIACRTAGVVDVDDCVAAGRFLVARGDVDPDRLAIEGAVTVEVLAPFVLLPVDRGPILEVSSRT